MDSGCNQYEVHKVTHPHAIVAEVPGSKSITNRALLLAAMAEGESVLHGVQFSDDSRHFLDALVALGFAMKVDEAAHKVCITGCGGRIPAREAIVDVGSAGTAARFLTALLGLSEGTYHMRSSEQMQARPMKELLTVLEGFGARIRYEGEEYHFPFIIENTGRVESIHTDLNEENLQDSSSDGNEYIEEKNTKKTEVEHQNKYAKPLCKKTAIKDKEIELTVDIDKSSQFLSALLIVSVLFRQGAVIYVTGSHGMAYVRMTVAMMRQFGLIVEESEDGRTYRIPSGAAYAPQNYEVEPDVSAACYFYAAGAILGVPARVKGVRRDSLQGDLRFLDVLCNMGCSLCESENEELVLLPIIAQKNASTVDQIGVKSEPCKESSGNEDSRGTALDTMSDIPDCTCMDENQETVRNVMLHGGSWDLSSFSDQALTLAAIAPFADAPVEIRGISHIRYQECDRIEAIRTNLAAMGVPCSEADGTIRITPYQPQIYDAEAKPSRVHPVSPHGAVIETYHDHRVAMAFAIPGLRLDGQVITDPGCCAKTFPEFFEELERSI